MDIVILKDSEQVAVAGAGRLQDLLTTKPDAVLGLATGRTPLAMYRQLVAAYEKSSMSFRDVTTFNLDEYLGIKPADPQSYRSYMQRELFDDIDIEMSNTHLPECAAGENPLDVGPRYEEEIRARGGIDLQVLGIGQNGHIGFNEPSSSLSSRTRVKTLTRETIANNRQYFDDAEAQPQLAITMGIATIMDANEILLLATGAEKAEAVRQSIEGPVSSMWPASILQMHERVTVLLDESAASALERRDYYNWVQDQKRLLLAQIENS
jgi:glucosamine-6-phosphate deaminase